MSNKLESVRIKVYDNRTHQLKWRTIRVPRPESYETSEYSAEQYLEQLNRINGRYK